MTRILINILFVLLLTRLCSGQELSAKNRLRVLYDNKYLHSDSLINKFNFYYSQNYTIAGMVDVPKPLKAIVWKDYYIDSNNQKKYDPNTICIAPSQNIDSLTYIIIEEKLSKRSTYVFLDKNSDNEFFIFNVPFKIGGFSANEIGQINLLDNPTFYLKDGILTKRYSSYKEIGLEEFKERFKNEDFIKDTLCNNISYPAYNATLILIRNCKKKNDSLHFYMKLKMPKRYKSLNIEHFLTYVPIDALDTYHQLEISLKICGKSSKIVKEKWFLISIPAILKPGDYWLNISKVFNEGNKEFIAGHSYLGCPMIIKNE
jgi:hypothetical protein